MNRKGFTLIEMLSCILLLGIVLAIGLTVTKGTLSSTFTQLNKVSFNEVKSAVNEYIIMEDVDWIDDEYVCISVINLVDKGYLKNIDEDTKNEMIKVIRNKDTKTIQDIFYSDDCIE